MWVAALPVGVNGKQLNSTFQSRDTSAYKVNFGLSYVSSVAAGNTRMSKSDFACFLLLFHFRTSLASPCCRFATP